ncbi:MAG: DUF748 domain-containing protein [Gammaproteobacteria bacterium]|nr:DUF748 domain-containing protein [Gammaproteobacteria bacterium]
MQTRGLPGFLADAVRPHGKRIKIAAVALALYALAGFVLAPLLLEKAATDGVRESLGTELRLDSVAINPFVLSLELNGIELDDPNGEPFIEVGRVFVNFQLSSLFRWAWTFREFHIVSPEVHLRRDADGSFNFAFLAEPQAAPADAPAAESGTPRLLIIDFAIDDSVVNWRDLVPPEPVITRFGPVDIAVAQLNTLPGRAGQQDVVIATESAGTLSWNGSLSLIPLLSEGHASVRGSHFPLMSAYMKHEIGFDVVDGTADIDFDYRVAVLDGGDIEASVSGLDLAFKDVIVNTFKAAHGIETPDRGFLQLPVLALSGASFSWPERRIAAAEFSIDDAVVNLHRNESGHFDILPPPSDAPAPDDEVRAPDSTGDAWLLSLDEFQIRRMALDFEDLAVEPAANIGVASLDLSVLGITNVPDARFPTSLTLVAGTGGTVSLEGAVTALPSPGVELDVGIDKLALVNSQPYLRPLADISLESGALSMAGKIQSSVDEPLLVTGDLEVADFLVTETDEGARLGSWVSLKAENLRLSLADNRVDVSEVRISEPYGDIVIGRDGSVNLGRVQKGEQSTDDDGDSATEESVEPHEEAEPPAGGNAATVTIGRVVIADGAADFQDLSLPLPFQAAIASLNGELSTIATNSSEPSVVTLEGKVDEFGLVRITGHATPIDPSLNTDIRVVFENVDMPKFSAYSIPFAGREIASGRLDLDLGYKVSASELEGTNRIVLRDFELGEKVDHPGALSLPLGLAVALLKDMDGKIDIDLPVTGNVDDPEFRYGGVIMKALGNLIAGIVTSPFRLLANLVGAEADELEYIAFTAGRADLSPPQAEKAAKIAEALSLRPELSVQIGGVVDPESDGAVLKTVKFDGLVEALIQSDPGDDSELYAEQRSKVIESLFVESGISPDPATALAELRAAHTTVSDEGTATFDALAFTESLRRQLVEVQPLTDDELMTLATLRADNVVTAILGTAPDLAARIVTAEPKRVSPDDDGILRLLVTLAAGEDLE